MTEEKKLSRAMRYKIRKKNLGLCIQCGSARSPKSVQYCESCREKARKLRLTRYARVVYSPELKKLVIKEDK